MRPTRFPLAVAALGTVMALTTPALAGSCNDPLETVFSAYAAAGNGPVMLNDDEIGAARAEFAVPDASRGFYVQIHGQMYLGVEVDGCLLPPIALSHPLSATRLSGTTAFGTYA